MRSRPRWRRRRSESQSARARRSAPTSESLSLGPPLVTRVQCSSNSSLLIMSGALLHSDQGPARTPPIASGRTCQSSALPSILTEGVVSVTMR